MKVSGIGYTDYSESPLTFVRRGKKGDCECGPGCQECWALAIGERFGNLPNKTTWYPEKLEKLAKMKFPEFSPKRSGPYRPIVFPCATGDLFHEDVPVSFIGEAFDVMMYRKDVVWLVLTKRAKRMRHLMTVNSSSGGRLSLWPKHIWLGVSVENQDYTWRIEELLQVQKATVKWVSLEPLLSAIDIRKHLRSPTWWLYNNEFYRRNPHCRPSADIGFQGLSWVVLGAESGANRRPFRTEWAADILHQCQEADVPCFLKQGSGLYPGKPLIVDGQTRKEWPNG